MVTFFSLLAYQEMLRLNFKEVFTGWLKAERVEIQQGNFLSAVTKTQGLILGGGAVKGIVLLQHKAESQLELLKFGEVDGLNTVGLFSAAAGDTESWQKVGLFSWRLNYLFKVPGDLEIVFLFYSQQLERLFMVYLGIILSVFVASGLIISLLEKRESNDREWIFQQAIHQLVTDSPIPEILKAKVPGLVLRWAEFKKLIFDLRKKEVESAERLAVAEISRQVAHDIRAPLSAINMAVFGLEEDRPNVKVIKGAVRRINDIADDLLQTHRNVSRDLTPFRLVRGGGLANTLLVVDVVRAILGEAKVAADSAGVRIELKNILCLENIYIYGRVSELERVLSNLLANSFEAVQPIKVPSVVISFQIKANMLAITINDNGVGIPEDVLSKLGILGYSYGKGEKGNGLGFYHAVQTIEAAGGKLEVRSNVGVGTEILITLPLGYS